jgi:hypothetical protein
MSLRTKARVVVADWLLNLSCAVYPFEDLSLDLGGGTVPEQELPRQSGGRVVKVTAHAEYEPDKPRRGGRMVKVMPRQLQKVKEGQERIRDE